MKLCLLGLRRAAPQQSQSLLAMVKLGLQDMRSTVPQQKSVLSELSAWDLVRGMRVRRRTPGSTPWCGMSEKDDWAAIACVGIGATAHVEFEVFSVLSDEIDGP